MKVLFGVKSLHIGVIHFASFILNLEALLADTEVFAPLTTWHCRLSSL